MTPDQCLVSSRPARLSCCIGDCEARIAGVYDVQHGGEWWRVPLCQDCATFLAAGAPIATREDLDAMASCGQCWGELREHGLRVCYCPSHGYHDATLALLHQPPKPTCYCNAAGNDPRGCRCPQPKEN